MRSEQSPSQRKFHTTLRPSDVAELAIKLCRPEDFLSAEFEPLFKKRFEYAFNLLVDCDVQLQSLKLQPKSEPTVVPKPGF